MARRRGRDHRPIPTVDLTSEYTEVERRQYHERLRFERREQERQRRTKSKTERDG